MKPTDIANETAWQVENNVHATGHRISTQLVNGIRQEILQEIHDGLLSGEDDVIAYVQEHIRLIGRELINIDLDDINAKVG